MSNQQDTSAISINKDINASDIAQSGTVGGTSQQPSQAQINSSRGDVTGIDSKYYNTKEVRIEKIKLP